MCFGTFRFVLFLLSLSCTVINAGTPVVDVATESVISRKDAVYRLSYANYDMSWQQFKLEHNRNYESPEEEQARFAIFMKNVKKIEYHNMQFHKGLTTYWMDINQFSDLTEEERHAKRCSLEVPEDLILRERRSVDNQSVTSDVPESIDWRTKGYVTDVKDQGDCGSCWAFGTTGSLESHWFKETGKLISLSEQQLVDCSRDGNYGCGGGRPDNAFKYIKSSGGIMSEDDYKYTETDGNTCKFEKEKVKARVSGYTLLQSGDEVALMNAVGEIGPVVVSIATSDNFHHYKGGIFVDNTCDAINHCGLVVGYNSSDGQDYWIVKNSYGAIWGINGYIHWARNKNNMCHIATDALYPQVDNSRSSPNLAASLSIIPLWEITLLLLFKNIF